MQEGASEVTARGEASESNTSRRRRWRAWPAVAVAALVGLGVVGFGAQAASADATWQGFIVSESLTPSSGFALGSQIQIQFELANGDSVTDGPLVASSSAPTGTTIVPHTQTCGTTGGTCGETPGESTLQWEVPAGAPAHSAFVFSYSVTVTTAEASIVPKLTYSGPGCSITECTYDAPQTSAQTAVAAASADKPTVIRVITQPVVRSSPTTDVQSLEVVVPNCKSVGSKPNNKTRVKCSGTPGPGTPAPGKSRAPSGVVFTSAPSGLAHTGVDLIRGIQSGLAAIGLGALLVLATGISRRWRTESAAVGDLVGEPQTRDDQSPLDAAYAR